MDIDLLQHRITSVKVPLIRRWMSVRQGWMESFHIQPFVQRKSQPSTFRDLPVTASDYPKAGMVQRSHSIRNSSPEVFTSRDASSRTHNRMAGRYREIDCLFHEQGYGLIGGRFNQTSAVSQIFANSALDCGPAVEAVIVKRPAWQSGRLSTHPRHLR